MEKNFKEQRSGIGRGILSILILLAGSIIFLSYYLLILRVISISKSIFQGTPLSIGVPISAGLLFFYCIFAFLTILFIFMKKKIAIKTFVITAIFGFLFLIWFFLIGLLINFTKKIVTIWLFSYNPLVIILILLLIPAIIYMLKSQRVRNTLIN
jgi:hypothetical protein